MIFEEVVSGKDMLLAGWLCRASGRVIEFPRTKPESEFCLCSWMCDYTENAWVFPDDVDDSYKNDYKAFLATLLDASSTNTFTLIDASENEYILNDSTYGEYFPLGFNTVQPLKVGYRIDWIKVYDLLGGGYYTVKSEQVDFGNTTETISHKYHVRLFDVKASNHSIKLETVQTGIILNGEDYGGMEWKNMVRIKGTFGAIAPQYEINRLQDSDRRDIDVQTSKFNQYTLSTELIPDFIGDIITDDNVLTDQIFISVNDIFNYKQYRRLEVVFDGSITAGDDYSMNNRKTFAVTMKDRYTKLKRHFV